MRNEKMIYLVNVLIMTFFIISCKKQELSTNIDNQDIVIVPSPFVYEEPACTPDTNSSTYYNGMKVNYGRAIFSTSTNYLSSGYIIKGSVSQQGGHSVEFRSKPKTQKYVTTNYSDINNDNQVFVYGRYGGSFSYLYKASSGDTVYVKVLDEVNEIYSVTFCDLRFNSPSSPILFFNSEGNLTNN